jgi:hypothetical protein
VAHDDHRSDASVRQALSRLSRRRFLGLATAATTGLALPLTADPVFAAAGGDAGSGEPGLSDHVSFGSAASERQHRVSASPGVTIETAGDVIGELREVYRVRTLSSAGDSLSCRVRTVPGRPISLEVREAYNRHADLAAYDVLVEGRQAYFRTFGNGDPGPIHSFVHLDDPQLLSKDEVKVTLRNKAGSVARISELWVWSDFAACVRQGGFEAPTLLYFQQPVFDWHDYQTDLARLRQLQSGIHGNDRFTIGFQLQLRFLKFSLAEMRRRIDYLLELSADTGMPMHIQCDTWWAGFPSGPDGSGGYWNDVQYQQVMYDGSGGAYQLSIPNMWNSTPWATLNSSRLNEYKVARLAEIVSYAQTRQFEMRSRGRRPQLRAFSEDSEVAYWAKGAAGTTMTDEGDFNPSVVAAAAKDGVALDPRDGLSDRERQWLFDNCTRYNALTADTAWNALTTDPAVVRGADLVLPADHLRENVYSQSASFYRYPVDSPVQSFWETGSLRRGRQGGEWIGMDRDLINEQVSRIALGRHANTNAEESYPVPETVALAAATGQDHVVLFNVAHSDLPVFQPFIDQQGAPFPEPAYEQVLFSEDFASDAWMQRAYQVSGVVRDSIVPYWVIEASGPNVVGRIVYRIAQPLPTGLHAEFVGRVFDYGDPANTNVSMTWYAGPSVSRLQQVARLVQLSNLGLYQVDLSAGAGGHETFVAVEFRTPAAFMSWNSVGRLRFTVPWAETPGYASGRVRTVEEARGEYRVVAFRRDAERLLPVIRHAPEYERAAALYARGDYAASYVLCSQAWSQMLPARYFVAQSGTLGRHPVDVTLNSGDPFDVTLVALDEEETVFRVNPALAWDVVLQVGGLRPMHWYRASHDPAGLYRLTPSEPSAGGLRADSKGMLTIHLANTPAAAPPATRVAGYYQWVGGSAAGQFLALMPPMAGTERADEIDVPFNGATTFLRGAEGTTPAPVTVRDLRFGDQVVVALGSDGAASSVTATFIEKRGAVQRFTPLGPFSMARLQFADGSSYIVDLNADLELSAVSGPLRAAPPGSVALPPGTTVQARINPDNRRIFTLQDHVVTFFDDYEEGDAWKQKAAAWSNVVDMVLDSNNPDHGLCPDDMSKLGTVDYVINSAGGRFTGLALQFRARSIIAATNHLSIYAGTSAADLKLAYTLRAGQGQDEGSLSRVRSVDLTGLASARPSVYVRIEMQTQQYNSWTMLLELKALEPFAPQAKMAPHVQPASTRSVVDRLSHSASPRAIARLRREAR